MIDQVALNVAKITAPGRISYDRVRAYITGDGEPGPGATLEIQDRRFKLLETVAGRVFPDGSGGFRFTSDAGETLTVERLKNCGCGGIEITDLS